MVQLWCSYSGHCKFIVTSDNVLANCCLKAWFYNLTLTSTISSSSIAVHIDRCCVFSLSSPNHIALKNYEHGSQHAIDTIKLPVNRKKTKRQSSTTALCIITQTRYPLHNSLWLFYREVLPLFQKFKYVSVSYPTKFVSTRLPDIFCNVFAFLYSLLQNLQWWLLLSWRWYRAWKVDGKAQALVDLGHTTHC